MTESKFKAGDLVCVRGFSSRSMVVAGLDPPRTESGLWTVTLFWLDVQYRPRTTKLYENCLVLQNPIENQKHDQIRQGQSRPEAAAG